MNSNMKQKKNLNIRDSSNNKHSCLNFINGNPKYILLSVLVEINSIEYQIEL